MMDDDERRIRRKINFFMDEEIVVHVKRYDGYFWNGLIIRKKDDDVYIMKEYKHGIVYLFISDVREIDEFKGEFK